MLTDYYVSIVNALIHPFQFRSWHKPGSADNDELLSGCREIDARTPTIPTISQLSRYINYYDGATCKRLAASFKIALSRLPPILKTNPQI